MSFLNDVRNLTREQKLVFVALFYGYFSVVAPSSLITLFFPAESEKHGVGNILRGILFSVQEAVSVLFGPFIGMAIVTFGPKNCFIIGISINGIFSIFLGLLKIIPSNDWFIVGAFTCLSMASLGGTITYITVLTYAAKIFPDHFNLIIGASELFSGIAEFTALSIGGVLHGVGGFALPFISFGVLHLISIAFLIFLLPSDKKNRGVVTNDSQFENPVYDGPEKVKNNTEDTTGFEVVIPSEGNKIRPWHLLKIPGAMLMVMVVLVTETSWDFIDSTLERHLSPLELSSSQTAAMFQITTVLYAVLCPLWGFISDKVTRTWVLIVSGLILGGAPMYLLGPLPIFGLDNTVWLNIFSLMVITLGTCLANIPATEACLLATIEAGHPDETATCAMVCSLMSTGYSLGTVIGTFAAGFLVEGVGYPLTSALFGSIMIAYGLVTILYFLVFHQSNKRLSVMDNSSGTYSRRNVRLPVLGSSLERSNPEALAQYLNVDVIRLEDEKLNIGAPLTPVAAGDDITLT